MIFRSGNVLMDSGLGKMLLVGHRTLRLCVSWGNRLSAPRMEIIRGPGLNLQRCRLTDHCLCFVPGLRGKNRGGAGKVIALILNLRRTIPRTVGYYGCLRRVIYCVLVKHRL